MKFSSLTKAIEIFDFFLERKTELEAQEISNGLDIPKSTTYKYLSILRELKLLEYRQESGLYRLGFKFFEYGQLVQAQFTIDKRARPFMKKLHDEFKETVILTVLSHGHAYCLDRIGQDQGLVYAMRRGSHLPLHAGASALVLLAFSEDEDIKYFLKNTELKKYTDNTITNPDKLKKRLQRIKENGFAYSDMEVDVGGRAVAAPIFDHLGKTCAGIGVVGPIQRMGDSQIELIKIRILTYSKKISENFISNSE